MIARGIGPGIDSAGREEEPDGELAHEEQADQRHAADELDVPDRDRADQRERGAPGEGHDHADGEAQAHAGDGHDEGEQQTAEEVDVAELEAGDERRTTAADEPQHAAARPDVGAPARQPAPGLRSQHEEPDRHAP